MRRGGRPRDGSHVHHVPLDGVGAQLCPCSLATSTPQAFLVASSSAARNRLRSRRPRYRQRAACTAARPISTRLEPVSTLKGVQPLVHSRYAFPSCLPDPSRLAVPTRPAVVRAASHPSLRFQGQAALSFTGLLRQAERRSPFISARFMAPRGALCRCLTPTERKSPCAVGSYADVRAAGRLAGSECPRRRRCGRWSAASARREPGLPDGMHTLRRNRTV